MEYFEARQSKIHSLNIFLVDQTPFSRPTAMEVGIIGSMANKDLAKDYNFEMYDENVLLFSPGHISTLTRKTDPGMANVCLNM